MIGIKEYVRPEDGYRIRVTEKAYNLFYRKQGFVPVIPRSEKAVLSELNKEATPEQDTDVESKTVAEAASESDAAPKKKRTKKASTEEQ